MGQFAAIDYGGPVHADLTGAQELGEAQVQHAQQITGATRNLGDADTAASGTYAQNVLHRQAVEAAAKASEGTEKALNTIETNPYQIDKETLLSSVKDPQVQEALWQKAIQSGEVEHHDGHDFVPTHIVGRDLYAAMSKEAREKAASGISLPGWKAEFLKTAETEALAKQERWIDPKLAAMGVQYDRTKTLQQVDKWANMAMTPDGFDLPIRAIKTSPSFSEPEKQAITEKLLARQDTVIMDKAMANVTNDPTGSKTTLAQEYSKLTGPDAAKEFPNHDEHGREELAQRVTAAMHHADVMDEYAKERARKADERNDEDLNSSLLTSFAEGKVLADSLTNPYGSKTDTTGGMWEKYKTFPGRHAAWALVENFMRNQSAGKDQDDPVAFKALSELRMSDPDKFREAMYSTKPTKTQYGTFNWAESLTPASMKTFYEQTAHLADKDRAEEDRVKMEHDQIRVANAMKDPDGGGVNAADYDNKQNAAQFANHEQFIRDTLYRAEREAIEGGKKLSPEQKTRITLDAAKEFKNLGKPSWGGLGDPNPRNGLVLSTANGKVPLSMSERTDMIQARSEAGFHGVPSVKKDGEEYYDKYKAAIDKAWTDPAYAEVFKGEKKSAAVDYQIFYQAKKLATSEGITDPATQLATIMSRFAAAAAARKSGGGK